MQEYRNVSGHPEDLESGRVIGAAEIFTLDDKDLESDYNKRKLEDGRFTVVPEVKQESERDALLKEAKELEVPDAEKLNNKKLAEAVADAKQKKEAQS